MRATRLWDALIVGGGFAGLSAAIYLGRAQRKILLIDAGNSMARWEPKVENYLGFPKGISGKSLLARGRAQARRYSVRFVADEVLDACKHQQRFKLRGRKGSYQGSLLLLATGICHIPPDISGVRTCATMETFSCAMAS